MFEYISNHMQFFSIQMITMLDYSTKDNFCTTNNARRAFLVCIMISNFKAGVLNQCVFQCNIEKQALSKRNPNKKRLISKLKFIFKQINIVWQVIKCQVCLRNGRRWNVRENEHFKVICNFFSKISIVIYSNRLKFGLFNFNFIRPLKTFHFCFYSILSTHGRCTITTMNFNFQSTKCNLPLCHEALI